LTARGKTLRRRSGQNTDIAVSIYQFPPGTDPSWLEPYQVYHRQHLIIIIVVVVIKEKVNVTQCRRFVTFYISALEILLLTYLLTICRFGGAVVGRRTRDRKVAGSTPGRGTINSTRSTQPSIPPGQVNRVPTCVAGVKAGCVHLCRV